LLTNTKIKKLKSSDKVYRVLDTDGLFLEVRLSGSLWWRYRFVKADGKRSMISLGEYPAVSIEAARKERDGRKAQGPDEISFRDVARQWFNHQNYTSVKNNDLMWRRIERYILPALGNMPISHIRPKHVLPILKAIERSGHLELARRVRTIISQVFRYGVVNLHCDSDPAYLLQGATKAPTVKHMAAIVDEAGFADLLRRIDAADSLSPSVKFCLEVAPYVFLRSGEIRNSIPSHLDIKNKLWTLPGEFMKLDKDLVVPMHASVIEAVESALLFSDGDFIFTGQRKGRPLSENTLNVALRSLGYSKDDLTFHGFRSTFSTLGREVLKFEDELIERQLAHVEKNNVRAAYDRSHRLDDRIIMMQRWGDYLDHLRGKKTGQ
jgi:integrase